MLRYEKKVRKSAHPAEFVKPYRKSNKFPDSCICGGGQKECGAEGFSENK